MSPTLNRMVRAEDSDLTKHSKVLQLRARRNRRQYLRNLLIALASEVILVLISVAASVYRNSVVYNVFSVASVIWGIVAVIVFVNSIPWIIVPLSRIDSAFMRTYKALDALQLSSKDDSGKDEEASLDAEQEAYSLLRSAIKELETDAATETLSKETIDLVDKFVQNLESRVLPAAEEGKLKPETLERMAKFLTEPTFSGLKAFNGEVETDYPNPKESETASLKQALSKLSRTPIGLLVVSVGMAFFIVIIGSLVYAYAIGQDLPTFAKNYPAVVFGGWLGLTAGLLVFLKK